MTMSSSVKSPNTPMTTQAPIPNYAAAVIETVLAFACGVADKTAPSLIAYL